MDSNGIIGIPIGHFTVKQPVFNLYIVGFADSQKYPFSTFLLGGFEFATPLKNHGVNSSVGMMTFPGIPGVPARESDSLKAN